MVGLKESQDFVYDHHDDEAVAIRQAFKLRESRWFSALQQRQDAEELAFLTLLQGFSWNPGPRWFLIAGLLGFNVVFDLVVVVIVRDLLGMLSSAQNICKCAVVWISIAGITVISYTVFLIPSAYFVRGYGASFFLLLIALPLTASLAISCSIRGIMALWELVVNRSWPEHLFLILFWGVVAWAFFTETIKEISALGMPVIGYPTGKGVLPYVLASCAVAPGLLSLAATAAAAGARVIGPVVIVPLEWYLKSVIETSSMVGITLLTVPSLVVELAYRVCEWIVKYHPNSPILQYFRW